MTALSASWIVVQLSTRVLSQSNKIARGRVRSCGAAAATLTLTLLAQYEPSNAPAIFGRKRHAPLIVYPPWPRPRPPPRAGTGVQAPIFNGRSLPKTPKDF